MCRNGCEGTDAWDRCEDPQDERQETDGAYAAARAAPETWQAPVATGSDESPTLAEWNLQGRPHRH